MRVACLVVCLSLAACSNPLDDRANQQAQKNASATAGGETASPKDAPMQYKVLADDVEQGRRTPSSYTCSSPAQPKHDDVDTLLKYLYRHLMTRAEPQPAGVCRLRLQRRGAVQDAAALADRQRGAEAG